MSRLALLLAPVRLALRRVRERPLVAAATALAVAAAGGLVGWSSLAAARSQERSVRLHLREVAPAQRAVRAVYSTPPLELDRDEAPVRGELARLGRLVESRHVVRIWHPVAPADESGVRLRLPPGGPRRARAP